LFWILLIVSTLSAPLLVTASHAHTVPACRMNDLDITFQSANPTIYAYTLAANFGNVSGHACALDRFAVEPSLFLQSAPSAALLTRCVFSSRMRAFPRIRRWAGGNSGAWHGGTSELFYFASATSTRRLSARPLAVALSATGRAAPNPCGTSWLAVTSCVVSHVTTDFARAWESGRLCASLP
jgi:hypothetical protein